MRLRLLHDVDVLNNSGLWSWCSSGLLHYNRLLLVGSCTSPSFTAIAAAAEQYYEEDQCRDPSPDIATTRNTVCVSSDAIRAAVVTS